MTLVLTGEIPPHVSLNKSLKMFSGHWIHAAQILVAHIKHAYMERKMREY